MDYEINLNTLTNKQNNLESLKQRVDKIYQDVSNSGLKSLSGTEISNSYTNLKKKIERLNKGYKNSCSWFKRYNTELQELESKLSEGTDTNVTSTKDFNGTFTDIFSKATIPYLKTGAELPKKDDSGVLEYKVGNLPEPGSIVRSLGKKAVLLDVRVNGESLGQDGSITIKRGQTVKLTVNVPDEIQGVNWLKRTSADGQQTPHWSNWAQEYSNPSVNRNNSNTFVQTRSFDWYITGTKNTNNVILSQTIFFDTDDHPNAEFKGMVRVRVKIVD